MSAVFEDIREVEPAPERAGLFSWFKKLRFRAAQPKTQAPKAGSPEADAYGRQEPFIADAADKEGPAVSPELKNDLLSSIARIWQQATVDLTAFERLKNFKVEPSPFEGTMAIVNDEDDIIYFGINPKDGSHAVMSPANISARHALEQVYVALTDDLMRTEGIDDVDGTDLDKALLCLAAEKNGLKINNMPVLSDEVKAEALRLWQQAFPEDAPAAPAATVAAATPGQDGPSTAATAQAEEEVISVDGTDILDAPAPLQTATEAAPADPDVIDAEFTEVKPAAARAALENTQPPAEASTIDDTADVTAAEAPPSVIILGYTPGPAIAPAAEPPAGPAVSTVKPAALDILRGDTAENSVDPETFENFMADLKDGKFSDDQGMLSEDSIRAAFTRPVGESTEADVMLRAAAAQGLIYATTKTVPALRMLVNPHVSSPVRYDPNKKAQILTEQLAAESPAAEAPAAEPPDSGKILAQAHIRPETYEAVKDFVAKREGDILRPLDLVHEFAAKAGIGAAKAHALMAALEADALITATAEKSHRVVSKAAETAQGAASTPRQSLNRGQHLQ